MWWLLSVTGYAGSLVQYCGVDCCFLDMYMNLLKMHKAWYVDVDVHVYMSCYRLWKKGSKPCIKMCESTSSIKDELLVCGAYTMWDDIECQNSRIIEPCWKKVFFPKTSEMYIDSCQNICKIIWKWILWCT